MVAIDFLDWDTCQGTDLQLAEKLVVCEDMYQGPTKEAAEKHCYFFHFCCRDVFRGACCLCFLLFSYFVPALEQLCNTLRLADHTAGSNFLMRTKLQAAAAN